jgi:hypothetical protein
LVRSASFTESQPRVCPAPTGVAFSTGVTPEQPPISKEKDDMKITAKTLAALTISALSLAVAAAAGASSSATPDDGYGSAKVIQLGHGPGGPAALADRGSEYGSAGLIQLGHGPGGPSKAPIDF